MNRDRCCLALSVMERSSNQEVPVVPRELTTQQLTNMRHLINLVVRLIRSIILRHEAHAQPCIVPSTCSTQTDRQKLLAIDPAIAVQIKLLNHSRKLFFAKSLAQFTRNTAEIRQIDATFTRCIKELVRS